MDSVNGYAAGASAAVDYSTYGLLVAQSTETSSRLNTLTEQASTGLVSSVFSGLGAGAATTLDLRAEIGAQQAQIAGISSADGKLTLTQSVLTQIGAIASDFYAQTNTLNQVNPGNVDVVAAAARSSLVQLAGLLNTQDGDDYLFAGSDTGQAPVPGADAILSSPFFTTISTAVLALNTNGAAATEAATLATASSNAPGTSPFSAQLSQSSVAVRATLPSVEIGNGQRVPIGIAAGANAAAISSGGSTTGSYIRDLLRGLATLGSLSSGQVDTTGFGDLVADTRLSLGGAVGAIADEQGILGNTQTQIDATGTLLTASSTALQSQVSNIEDVNIAAVSTELTQTQANLQASYKLIAGMSNVSLLKYL